MWAAWAAETAGHGHEAFYATAEFWVGVGFFLFVGLVGRTAYRVMTVALDERASRIKNQIDESERLAQEAQAMLADAQMKQKEAAATAGALIESARREAQRFAEQAAKDLEAALARREQSAKDRIAQAEAEAVAEVRRRAADLALEASRQVIAGSLTPAKSDALIDQAIAGLPKALH